MSAEARPIPADQFALAIQDLPVENIYAKAFEIDNSVAHLQRSNAQLQDYSDSIKNDTSLDESVRSEGDKDCLEAIAENQVVITRQLERIQLLKSEVERRGGRWHESGLGSDQTTNGASEEVHENGDQPNTPSVPRPRLTDEELRRRLEEQLGDGDGGDEEEEEEEEEEDGGGLHL